MRELIFGARRGQTSSLQRRPHVVGVWWKSQHRKKLCLSLLMSKNLKLKKVIKCFVPEPKESRQVFRVFRIPIRVWSIWTFNEHMYISRTRIWLCNTSILGQSEFKSNGDKGYSKFFQLKESSLNIRCSLESYTRHLECWFSQLHWPRLSNSFKIKTVGCLVGTRAFWRRLSGQL